MESIARAIRGTAILWAGVAFWVCVATHNVHETFQVALVIIGLAFILVGLNLLTRHKA